MPSGGSLSKNLKNEEYSTLVVEFQALARRYPSQDVEQSTDAYLEDFEALALRYSLRSVVAALRELRIRPGQKFFPRPDEVAEEIERKRETGLNDALARDGKKYSKQMAEWAHRYNSPEEIAWRMERGLIATAHSEVTGETAR
jgi:hypothetical protein